MHTTSSLCPRTKSIRFRSFFALAGVLALLSGCSGNDASGLITTARGESTKAHALEGQANLIWVTDELTGMTDPYLVSDDGLGYRVVCDEEAQSEWTLDSALTALGFQNPDLAPCYVGSSDIIDTYKLGEQPDIECGGATGIRYYKVAGVSAIESYLFFTSHTERLFRPGCEGMLQVLGLDDASVAWHQAPEGFFVSVDAIACGDGESPLDESIGLADWCEFRNESAALNATLTALLGVTGTADCMAAQEELASWPQLSLASRNIVDVRPLGSLRTLAELDLSDNPGLGSIEGLQGLAALEKLDVSSTGISDLEPIAGLRNLQELRAQYTLVSSLEPVAALRRLRVLDVSDPQGNADATIADLDPVGGLIMLRELRLRGHALVSLEPLARLRRLAILDISDNDITSVQPLSGLSTLQWLDASNNALTDLRPLSLLSSLSYLNAAHNVELRYMRHFRDWCDHKTSLTQSHEETVAAMLSVAASDVCADAAATLAARRVLSLRGRDLTELSPLSSLTGLERLNLAQNQIENLSTLDALTSIVWLDLSDNADLSSLAGISAMTGLRSLNIARTGVSSLAEVASLVQLRRIDASDSSLSEDAASVLSELWSLAWLDISGTRIYEGNAAALLALPPNLRSLFVRGTGLTSAGFVEGLALLERIDLGQNALTGLWDTSTTPQIADMSIESNALLDVGSVWGLPSLRSLDVSDNPLDGALWDPADLDWLDIRQEDADVAARLDCPESGSGVCQKTEEE